MSRAEITRISVPLSLSVNVAWSRRPRDAFPSALRFKAVPCIFNNEQGIIKKNTFRLRLTNVMFVRALAAVAVVPLEADNLPKVDHCI